MPEPADQPVPDLQERNFTAGEPNRVYVGDITYLPCGGDQTLYLATVIDCFSADWWAGRSPTARAPNSSPTL